MQTEQPISATDLAGRSLGDIATHLPGATAIFLRSKLDFCCGGAASLAEAAAEQGLDLDMLVAELAALRPAEAAETVQEAGPLIEHILTRFHAVHRQELPELIRLAGIVERVHQANPAVPAGLAETLQAFAAEMEVHMRKEELILFPLMREGGASMIGHPIARMRHEHDDHGERLRQIMALTRDLTAPRDACATWQALYAGLGKLVGDLMEHIHLENNVLFPQFATDLPAVPLCNGRGGAH
jgi:regulator of cell morphogenesis and NO signaling